MKRIEDYLRLFVQPGQVTELRAFRDKAVMNGFFDYEHIGEMATAAAELERTGCQGIYFLPNPINPALLELSKNKIKLGGKAASDADILRREWLLVDIDPVRPGGNSATEAERLAAWGVCSNVQATMQAGGFRVPIVASSGNGWHLSYRMAGAENNDLERDRAKRILTGLDSRLSNLAAKVDVKTYNASRIWKLYGTRTRKGPVAIDRPHRVAFIVDGERPDAAAAAANRDGVGNLLLAWDRQQAALTEIECQTIEPEVVARARAYIARIPGAVSGSDGHGATFHVAGLLVDGWGLDQDTALQLISEWNARCVPPWTPGELLHKIKSAEKHVTDRGHLARQRQPLPATLPALQPAAAHVAGEVTEDADPDATAEDLIALQATIRWTWPNWIQRGTLTCLASDPGVGKTRLCADLAKRIWHGMPWPDGTPATLPKKSKVLWVAADSQWAELGTLPGEFGFPPAAIILNGRRSNPYAGTNLDAVVDLIEFERRIVRNNPGLILIDTCGNATDRNQGRPEEAKQFFKPLAEIATRTNTSIVLVTHLNRGGQVLGARIVGAVRQVISLEQPDGEWQERRKLSVSKTNSVKPPPLGVTMRTGGNDYDATLPGDTAVVGKRSSNADPDKSWLREKLAFGAVRVSKLRDEATASGITPGRLYRAKDAIEAVEFDGDGRKFWRMPDGD